MENCYELLGIAPTAGTEEIEEAYQRKKNEFGTDGSKQKELDIAYNEAIMATFAPIRAFSSPLPPLATGKQNLQNTRSLPFAPQQKAPVSFTNAELINMDVSELRESYITYTRDEDEDKNETGFFTLGIENKLLRYYVKTYIVMVLFDMVMRLWLGPRWLALTEVTIPDRTPALLSILFAFLSIVYCFVCALPMPFAARFFLLGQPPDKSSMLWALFFLGTVCAFFLRWLTGRFLPLNIVGSEVSLTVIAMALSLVTLRYGGE